MRVVIVKHEGKLLPLIASEEETVGDLMEQWKKNANKTGNFLMRLVDSENDEFISSATLISELPLPRPGYSSIEITAHRMSTLKLIFGSEKNAPSLMVSLPLTSSLDQLQAACCEAMGSERREVRFWNGQEILSDTKNSLGEMKINDGDSLTAEVTIYLAISRLGEEEEEKELSGSEALKKFFSDDIPAADQRFYDSFRRQVNSEEPSIRSVGMSAGATKDERVHLLYVSRIPLRIRTPPSSKDGFAEPEDQEVMVWPHKSVSCLMPRDKPELVVWFQDKRLQPHATFWESGIGPNQLLHLDKKMEIEIWDADQQSSVKLEVRRSARVRDLTALVAGVHGQHPFDLFAGDVQLFSAESTLLRRCGVRDGSAVEKRARRVDIVLIYEGRRLQADSIAAGAPFRTVLERVQEKVDCELGANTYLVCSCGRRLSADSENGEAELARACCATSPRQLTVHRLVNVKVVEEEAKARHIHMDSTCSLQDVLTELGELSGVRLMQGGVVKLESELLKDCFQYLSNRTQFSLERKMAIGVKVKEKVTVRWVWPSSALGSLVQSLKAKGEIGEGRVSVMLGERQLASYGKTIAVCQKKLTDYGIEDGSVISMRAVEEQEEEEFAEFMIISSKWKIENFKISVAAPPQVRPVFDAVRDGLRGTRKNGCIPILAQVQGVGENGNVLLFSAAHQWTNLMGEHEEPAFSPKFRELKSLLGTVYFVPGVVTKIHIRRWTDGST